MCVIHGAGFVPHLSAADADHRNRVQRTPERQQGDGEAPAGELRAAFGHVQVRYQHSYSNHRVFCMGSV
jgi:hypothetical protein